MHLRFHFKKHEKLQKKKKSEEKGAFDVAVDGPIDGASLNLKFGSLRILYVLYSAEQTELLTFSN